MVAWPDAAYILLVTISGWCDNAGGHLLRQFYLQVKDIILNFPCNVNPPGNGGINTAGLLQVTGLGSDQYLAKAGCQWLYTQCMG